MNEINEISLLDTIKFQLALVTEDYIFYVNDNETDENANTKMYDRKMNLLSDNYFANGSYLEELQKIHDNKTNVYFMSISMLYAYKEMEKEGFFNEE